MPSIPPRRRRRGHLTLALAPLALLLPASLIAQADVPEAFSPDVTVIYLGSTSNWGAAGGVRAYSVGTTSCNIGNQPIDMRIFAHAQNAYFSTLPIKAGLA